jgi:hypothetical protein
MAIFAGHRVGDQAVSGLVYPQGFTGQSFALLITQGFEPARSRFDTIAVNNFDAIPIELGLASAINLLDPGCEHSRTLTH